jgi:transcription elongation factor Spt5
MSSDPTPDRTENAVDNLFNQFNGLKIGSIVEIQVSSFKGERAQVIAIDSLNKEVTIEMIDSPIPIPITIRDDQILTIRG